MFGKRQGFFITGTDTEVGKTQVTAGLAAVFRRQMNARSLDDTGAQDIRLWKPIQTGVQVGKPDADSFRLKAGSGISAEQSEENMVSITLPEPLAPWIAARRSGLDIDFEALVREGKERLRSGGFWLVEGAGGLGVPLTAQHMMVNLAAGLDLPLLIVARAGLGTVNHTLQTVAFARQYGLEVAGVILNGYHVGADEERVDENAEMIERFAGVHVVAKLPWLPEPQGQFEEEKAMDQLKYKDWRMRWTTCVMQHLDIYKLMNIERV